MAAQMNPMNPMNPMLQHINRNQPAANAMFQGSKFAIQVEKFRSMFALKKNLFLSSKHSPESAIFPKKSKPISSIANEWKLTKSNDSKSCFGANGAVSPSNKHNVAKKW